MSEKSPGRFDGYDVLAVAAWVVAVGLVLGAAAVSHLMAGPIEQIFREWSRSYSAPLPGSAEASITHGVPHPVHGPVSTETDLSARTEVERVEDKAAVAAAPVTGLVVAPQWRVQPRPEFPSTAAYADVAYGRVALECLVRADGLISACRVMSETPEGMGFGRAALAAMTDARLHPRKVDGVPAQGVIRFATNFRLA